MIVIVTILILGGMAWTNLVTSTTTRMVDEFNSDIDFRSRNFHRLVSRDILLASSMESGIDSLPAIEVRGDTLIIRFADLDSVRYYLNGWNIYREDVPVADRILSFTVTQNTIIVDITLDVAAQTEHRWVNDGNVYHRQYEWVTVLNDSQF